MTPGLLTWCRAFRMSRAVRIEVTAVTVIQGRVVKVTDETTRADLAETLALLNTDAKAMSRRGKVGTLSEAYAAQHRRIDAVLDDYLAAPS